MAKTTHNARQLTITGSLAAMADMQTSLNDNAVFMMQVSGGSDPVQLIKAQDMQNYFSDIDVDAVSSGEYSLVFIDPAGADGVTSGFDFKRDSEGNSAVSWDASANRMKIVGDLRLDHDGAEVQWGDDQEIVLSHVADTGLRLSGSSGGQLQFRDADLKIHSSTDGQLDIEADVKLYQAATQLHLSGGSSGLDIDSAGAIYVDGNSSTTWTSKQGITFQSYISGQATGSYSNFNAYAGGSGSVVLSAGQPSVYNGSNPTLSILGQGSYVHLTGGYLHINDTAEASSTTTGALRVAGGAGIAKDLYVGDDLTLASDAAVITVGSSGGGAQVTLTHVSAAVPALRVQAAKKLSFGDEATFVQQSSDGVLQVQADTTLDLNGGAVDIDGNAKVSIDTSDTSNGITIGTETSGVPVSIGHTTSEVTVNDNFNVTGDTVLAGNLTVNGTTTTLDTTNLRVEDTLILLGSGSTSVSDGDRGLILELSSTNQSIFWDQSATEFALVSTTSHHTSSTISVSDYSDLHVGGLDVDDSATLGSSASDTLSVLSTATFTPTADFDGGLTVAAGQNIAGDGQIDITAGALLQISGAAGVQFDSAADFDQGLTIAAGKDIAADGQIDITAGALLQISGASGVQFDSAADFDQGLTVAAGKDIAGDGQLNISAGAAMTVSAAGQLDIDASAGKIQLSSSTGIELESAADVTAVLASDSFWIKDASDNGYVKSDTIAHVFNLATGDGLQNSDASGIFSIDAVRKEFNGSGGLSGSYSSGRAFAFDSEPLDDSIQVFLNGMLQTPSSSSGLGASVFDYVLSGTYGSGGGLQVVFESSVVDTNDAVVVHYIKK